MLNDSFSSFELKNNKNSNFGFLMKDYPFLFGLCEKMEYYYGKDERCFFLQVRLVSEYCCASLINSFPVDSGGELEFSKKIKILSTVSKIPDYIIRSLNKLRDRSNSRLHISGSDVEAGFAPSSQGELHDVAVEVFELVVYYFYSQEGISKVNSLIQDAWVEPAAEISSEILSKSLQGESSETLKIAIYFYEQLKITKKTAKAKVINRLKCDLEYWSQKALQQGSHDVWLLLAKAAVNNYLSNSSEEYILSCFEKALQHDKEGEAYLEFGHYVYNKKNLDEAMEHFEKSAQRGCSIALENCLLFFYYKNHEEKYLKWVDFGVSAENKVANSANVLIKLLDWKQSPTEESEKTLRNTFLKARTTHAPGIEFFQGLFEFEGIVGFAKEEKKGVANVLSGIKSIPKFLHYEKLAFNVLITDESGYEDAWEIRRHALFKAIGEERSQLLFHVLKLYQKMCKRNRVELQKREVTSEIKKALLELLELDYLPAVELSKTPEGKYILRQQLVRKAQGKKVSKKSLKSKRKRSRIRA